MKFSLSRKEKELSQEYGGTDGDYFVFVRNENVPYHSKPNAGHYKRSLFHNPRKRKLK